MMNFVRSTVHLLIIIGLIDFTLSSYAIRNHPSKRFSKREVDDSISLIPTVHQLHVISSINSRFAMTHVTSRLSNPEAASTEIVFTMTLPDAAFISNFSMKIGDKVIVGEVKEKEEAKKDYDAAVARGESAGHVAQARETNLFHISANVGAMDSVTFNLTYQQLLSRNLGYYKHAVNIKTDQIVDDMKIMAIISEKARISDVYIPKFQAKISDKSNVEIRRLPPSDDVTVVEQVSDEESIVFVDYTISKERQMELGKDVGMDGQMVVIYSVDRSAFGDEIQVVNGYFVHFFAPSKLTPGKKHVVFLLDKSGSMTGRKMEQTKEAMSAILEELDDGDVFNIVTFSSSVARWKSESVLKSTASISDAKKFVQGIQAGGGTNINSGLEDALKLINSEVLTGTLGSMVVFMTDGQATSGVTDTDAIMKTVQMVNKEGKAIIHSIAFGNDADFKLLKKVSLKNKGIARKVYEDSDAALQLENFFAECSKLLLADVKITYLNETVQPESLVQDTLHNYYEGSEIVVAGKVDPHKIYEGKQLKATVEAESSEGSRTYEISKTISKPIISRKRPHPPFPLPCIIGFPYPFPQPHPIPSHQPLPVESIGGFVERTWAYLTIKKLLDKIKYDSDDEEKKALKKKALNLSIKYQFVTELTSMVVIQGNSTKSLTESKSKLNSRGPIAYGGQSRAHYALPSFSSPMLRGPSGPRRLGLSHGSGHGHAVTSRRQKAIRPNNLLPNLTINLPTTPPPPKCDGDHEIVMKCGNKCQKSCDTLMVILPCLTYGCGPPACGCETGYARHEGLCIEVSSCPNIKCGANERRVSGCINNCEQKCGDSPEIWQGVQCQIQICDTTRCLCNVGYVRNENGTCVLPALCPTLTIAGCPDPMKKVVECDQSCLHTTCDDLANANADADADADADGSGECPEECGEPVCVCKDGFLLNKDGSCVTIDQCNT